MSSVDYAALMGFVETDRQREIVQALIDHGSTRKAAKALGVKGLDKTIRSLREKAARQGHAPGHWNNGTAPGYLMGKVTVQRGREGEVERVWERQHPDDRLSLLRSMIEGLCEPLSGRAKPIPAPAIKSDDCITVIPMGDPHAGMLAWEKETGAAFDLEIFDRRLRGALDRIIKAAPASTTCLFINLGDMFHANDGKGRTPTGNNDLDTDGRYVKIAVVVYEAMIYAIDRLREKYERVIVWNKPGNHDPEAWLALTLPLFAHYRNEPRVEIPIDPSHFSYLQFGKNLFGSTHGHGPKPIELPMIMATDRPKEWGSTVFRTWFIGHFHHRMVQKDLTGCTVEIARTLASNDAWHHMKGYRSFKDIQAIVFHKDFGEIERHTCSLAMIESSL